MVITHSRAQGVEQVGPCLRLTQKHTTGQSISIIGIICIVRESISLSEITYQWLEIAI